MSEFRAVALRQDGYTISDIAAELGLPRSTVGDIVKGIDPLPHASLTPDAVDPDLDRLKRLRATCTACDTPKAWTEFWAAARWPDGTMRRPQSHCKDCFKAARRKRRRDDPEWARDINRKDWQRIKNDPVMLAKRRVLTRENSHIYRLRRREQD